MGCIEQGVELADQVSKRRGCAVAPGQCDARRGLAIANRFLLVLLEYVAGFLLEHVWWGLVLLLGRIALYGINWFLDWWAPAYNINVFLPGKSVHIGGVHASDGAVPPGLGVSVALYAGRYGAHRRETYDVLLAKDRDSAKPGVVVVYVHGGGWIAANSGGLVHSITPLVRGGYDVYSIDYPLAPEASFPDPVLSVLRFLKYLKREKGHGSVFLLGDSAGGNLVTMASAALCNGGILRQYSPSDDACCYPSILGVSSIYGIMDQEHWKRNLPCISLLENKVTQFCIEFAFRMYRCRRGTHGNKLTLFDIMDQVHAFPPAQLLCGSKDVLVHSNRAMYSVMNEKGFRCDYFECEARHCYFGFPPGWLGDYESTAKASVLRLLGFINELHEKATERS